MFASSPYWNALDRKIRKVFHGMIGCANNGPTVTAGGNCGRGAVQRIDAYPQMQPPLLQGWETYDRLLGAGAVETEVGIAAVARAYRRPYRITWPGAALDPAVQAHWFAAACRAAINEHLGGIYFWSIGLSPQPATGPTSTYLGDWAAGPGAKAISGCFKRLVRSGS